MKLSKRGGLGMAVVWAFPLMLLFSFTSSPPEAAALDGAAQTAETPVEAPRDNGQTDTTPPPVKIVKAKDIAKLLEKAKGKVVLLNLWATWCPPCLAEMPYFAEFFTKYRDKGFAMLSISADGVPHIDDALRPYLEKNDLPFPVYVLDETEPKALAEAMKSEPSGALPQTFLYDKEGTLKEVWSEEITLDMLEAAVKPLL